MGKTFRGVFSLLDNRMKRFTPGGEKLSDDVEVIEGLDNPRLDELFPLEMDYVRESIELIQGASEPFSRERFLEGSQTPVFFGSGVNNFGVEDVLKCAGELGPAAAAPRCRKTHGRARPRRKFSGFVFKIQANMDPKHRDRIAFFRVCSGRILSRA